MTDASQEILRVIEDVIAPLVRADGGQLHLVEATDTSVTIHLTGRYAGCPGNTLAHRRVIEPAIQKVAPGARITVTSGAIVPSGAKAVGAR